MKKSFPATMAVLNILALLLLGVVLTGCADVSPEDRDFYYHGWVNPNAPEKQNVLPPAP